MRERWREYKKENSKK